MFRNLWGPLLFDPLAVKELSGISRRWQTYVTRGLYVAIMAVVVYIFRRSMMARGGLGGPSELASMAHSFFITFIVLQMLTSVLGGLSAGSDLITREIRNGTLGLLALTPLSSWRIAAGKWKAAMIQTATGLLCWLPVFGMLVYLGGIGLWEFAYTFTLSAACAALGAAVGMFWSTVVRAGYVATIASVITILAYCILPTLLLIQESDFYQLYVWVHPLFAAIGAVSQGTFGRRIAGEAVGWISATASVALQVWLLLRWSASRIETLVLESGAKTVASAAPLPADAEPRAAAFARFLRGKEGVWDRNAILWKELSTRRFGVGTLAQAGLALLGLFLFTAILDSNGFWRIVVYWISAFIFVLVALANGVSLFVTEREERKWEVLLSTPLPSTQIVLAKLLAGMAGLAPMALSLAVFWFLFQVIWGASMLAIVMNLSAVGMVALFAYGVGAVASLHARSQRTAFSSSFGVVLALLFVLPIMLMMADAYATGPRGGMSFNSLGSFNPAPFMSRISEYLSRSARWNGPDYYRKQELQLLPYFLVFTGLHLGVVAGLVLWMAGRFNRAVGRL